MHSASAWPATRHPLSNRLSAPAEWHVHLCHRSAEHICVGLFLGHKGWCLLLPVPTISLKIRQRESALSSPSGFKLYFSVSLETTGSFLILPL